MEPFRATLSAIKFLNIIYTILVVSFLIGIRYLRKKNDEEKHGKLTREDKINTTLISIVIFSLLLILGKYYMPGYLLVAGIFVTYALLVGGGTGQRGLYRQARDGGIFATIFSMPIVLFYFSHQ